MASAQHYIDVYRCSIWTEGFSAEHQVNLFVSRRISLFISWKIWSFFDGWVSSRWFFFLFLLVKLFCLHNILRISWDFFKASTAIFVSWFFNPAMLHFWSLMILKSGRLWSHADFFGVVDVDHTSQAPGKGLCVFKLKYEHCHGGTNERSEMLWHT